MAARVVKADRLNIPRFKWRPRKAASVFDLSSHGRAKEALDFGMSMSGSGFNIFVLGPDGSGRLTETRAYLSEMLEPRDPVDDWVYLNNFARPHRPKPYRLKPGTGRALRDAMAGFVADLRRALRETFEGDAYQARVKAVQRRLAQEAEAAMAEIRAMAGEAGLGVFPGEQGAVIAPVDAEGKPMPFEQVPEAEREAIAAKARGIAERVGETERRIAKSHAGLNAKLGEITRDAALETIRVLLAPLKDRFGGNNLNRWFVELEGDILDHLGAFGPAADAKGTPAAVEPAERRYAVNLFVDNGDATRPPIILESNPTYENLFGRIEYRPGATHLETDFSLVRAGALHRANGGVLVLRAEALAMEPMAWPALIACLRDGKIRIEERHRQQTMPVVGAPSPKAIPLDITIVLVGSPMIYYAGYSKSPDFQALFQVKADIAPDMPATAANLGALGTVLRRRAEARLGRSIDDGGIGYLMGLAARVDGDRTRVSSRLELLDDVVSEAAARAPGERPLSEADLTDARAARLRRNDQVEARSQDVIERGTVLIDTAGAVVGQINGLTVRDYGDHAFGGPSRITARASVGRHGVINIERQVALGGPIQQKGAMVLEGYLSGLFARAAPLSFNCSITFEQNYGGVEGDSASLAELIAILSDLAEVPIRQDLGITGSVNQLGEAQSVGGVHHKVEGFFKACSHKPLTGDQGVIVPASNADNLVLDDAVAEAARAGTFHLYTVRRVEEAAELLTGLPCGKPNKAGIYPEDSLYGRVQRRLAEFDAALFRREAALAAAANTG
jgi:predicted ATP-dependent protease